MDRLTLDAAGAPQPSWEGQALVQFKRWESDLPSEKHRVVFTLEIC